MAEFQNDIDRAIAALQATKLVRDVYGGATAEGAALMDGIVKALALRDNGHGQYGGICKNVADAISKAFLNRPLS